VRRLENRGQRSEVRGRRTGRARRLVDQKSRRSEGGKIRRSEEQKVRGQGSEVEGKTKDDG